MPKKKIGTLYNKPIVEGDINLVTTNETHINSLSINKNESNNESVSTSNIKYYKVIFDSSNEAFITVFSFLPILSTHSVIVENRIINRINLDIMAGDGSEIGIIPTNPFYYIDSKTLVDLTTLKGFSIYTDKQTVLKTTNRTNPSKRYMEVEGDIVKQIATLFNAPESEIASFIEAANIKEITEEEYNKLIEQ